MGAKAKAKTTDEEMLEEELRRLVAETLLHDLSDYELVAVMVGATVEIVAETSRHDEMVALREEVLDEYIRRHGLDEATAIVNAIELRYGGGSPSSPTLH